jgi:hypothetical protein
MRNFSAAVNKQIEVLCAGTEFRRNPLEDGAAVDHSAEIAIS